MDESFNPPPPPGMPGPDHQPPKESPLELGALAWFFIALAVMTVIGLVVGLVQ